MSIDLKNILKKRVILGDGAMGTQLYQRGIYINRSFEGLNISDPDLVKSVHRDYISAGAELIETNTFGASPIKLAKFGLSDQAYEINLQGALLARESIDKGSNVLAAGSIGPIGKPVEPIGKTGYAEALEAFRIQVKGLVDGGVDVFILETFLHLKELNAAIQAVKEFSDAPIITLMTITGNGATAYGKTPTQIARSLDKEPVDVIGLNCSVGPQQILKGIAVMKEFTDKPLAAFPNAGEPEVVDGRIIYLSTPEYLAEFAKRLIQSGASMVGGCCGTTPKHISAMASAVKALSPGSASEKLIISTLENNNGTASEKPLPPRGIRSPLGALLDKSTFPISCELNPPRSPSIDRIVSQIRLLQKSGIDLVNIPDGPRASARINPMVLAHLIQRETGIDTILHYTCRDRNILGMQSDLLGAHVLGLRNILMITGDPPKLGDYPMATAVFDVDAIGLLRIGNNLNHGLDLIGNSIPKSTSFFLGAGFNPGAIDIFHEIDRIHQKIEAGAEYIMTQPVFDHEKLLSALDRAGEVNLPVFVGILPLASYRNAEFFHNEVPGMDVPEHIRERMRKASDKGKEFGYAEGIAIAQEALLSARTFVQGAYIMPPFGRVETAIETASVIEKEVVVLEAH